MDDELDALAAEFETLDDWEDRYRYIIDLGRELEPLSEAEHADANKVRGCASQVWLVTEPGADGALHYRGDSDAHIVRGLIAILLRLYADRAPIDFVKVLLFKDFAQLPNAEQLLKTPPVSDLLPPPPMPKVDANSAASAAAAASSAAASVSAAPKPTPVAASVAPKLKAEIAKPAPKPVLAPVHKPETAPAATSSPAAAEPVLKPFVPSSAGGTP